MSHQTIDCVACGRWLPYPRQRWTLRRRHSYFCFWCWFWAKVLP